MKSQKTHVFSNFFEKETEQIIETTKVQLAICKVVADVEEKTRMILSREGINVINHQV